MHWHSATLSGLSAGTTYHYRVYSDGTDLTPWSDVAFTTAPAPSATGLRFVNLGDSRLYKEYSQPSQGALDVAAEIGRHDFDLACHTGDIVYSGGVCSGDDSGWNQYLRNYFGVYGEILGHAPFYTSIGNHELLHGTCGYESYTSIFHLPDNAPAGSEETFYSFDWANAHFVTLDTNQDYTTGSPQYNWLVNDLQNTSRPWKLIFFHDPAYSSGLHGSTPDVIDHLVPVFEANGVDVVLNGHDHDYERTCPILAGSCTSVAEGGVVYYVSGGAGAPLREVGSSWFTQFADSLFHFLLVTVDDCSLRVDALDTNGQVFDSYTVDKCP
jgi:hypothetical protein